MSQINSSTVGAVFQTNNGKIFQVKDLTRSTTWPDKLIENLYSGGNSGNWPLQLQWNAIGHCNPLEQWNTWVKGTLLSASSSYLLIPKNIHTTIPWVASWNSKGKGGFLDWSFEGIEGWSNTVWNSKGMGGFSYEFPGREDSTVKLNGNHWSNNFPVCNSSAGRPWKQDKDQTGRC